MVISSCSVKSTFAVVLFVAAMVVASDESGVGWYFGPVLVVVKVNRIRAQKVGQEYVHFFHQYLSLSM